MGSGHPRSHCHDCWEELEACEEYPPLKEKKGAGIKNCLQTLGGKETSGLITGGSFKKLRK